MRAPFVALLVLLGTLLAGMWIGGHAALLPAPLRDAFRDDDETAVVTDVIERVHDTYYRDVDRADLANLALSGLTGQLDQFSAYLDPAEYRRFQQAGNERFSGIGVTVNGVDRGLRIGEVYDSSPAREAGLRPGDVLVAANGRTLGGIEEDAATALVRGPAGSAVDLRIRRGSRTFGRRVERRQVDVPLVTAQRRRARGDDVAVLRLRQFASGAHGELYAALRRAMEDDVDGAVLDLRGNPGGLVEEARLVASAFLDEGEIVTTRGRAVPEQVYRATGEPVAADLPLVVLVDRDSASASEIVAGALQDRRRAEVVGRPTFGKGVFQSVTELENGGALDLTVGQYFTPKGTNLGAGVEQGEGIKPDVRALDRQRTSERDEALDRALRVLTG